MEGVIFHLWKHVKCSLNKSMRLLVGVEFVCVIEVNLLTPSLVKNSKAALSRLLAASMGAPSFQDRQSVGNPKGSAP